MVVGTVSHVTEVCDDLYTNWFATRMRLCFHPRFTRIPYHPISFIQRRYISTAATDMPVNRTAHPFDKTRFDALLNRRFFYAPAFEIYGGTFALHISMNNGSW
jgi:hypothetical protein